MYSYGMGAPVDGSFDSCGSSEEDRRIGTDSSLTSERENLIPSGMRGCRAVAGSVSGSHTPEPPCTLPSIRPACLQPSWFSAT